MRFLCAIVLFGWISALGYAQTSPVTASVPRVWVAPFFNGIAAQVGSVLITYDDIRHELAGVSAQLHQAKVDQATYEKQMQSAYTDVLNALIDRELLIEAFDQKGFQVPQNEIDFQYNQILNQKYEGKISNLAAELQKTGMTLAEFKQDLTDNMKAQVMQGRFSRNLPAITPDQIKAYYDAHPGDYAAEASVKIATITLKPMADEPPAVVVEQANNLKKQIEEGADFAQLARENSVDANASAGGEWDWVPLKQMGGDFQKAIANLLPGELSHPIVMDFDSGEVMLIKMLDRKDEKKVSLQEASPKIEKILRMQQANEAYDKMIAKLRKQTFIRIYND